MSTLSLNKRLEYLVNGYININFLFKYKQYKKKYPLCLSSIILIFLGNILLCFDTYPLRWKKCITNNGKIFKKLQHVTVMYSVGCSYGWNEGIHSFKIKCVKVPNHKIAEAFGIISNINECKDDDFWYGFSKHNAYVVYNKNITGIGVKAQYNVCKQFKNGDIIEIKIDCNNWNVTFFVNNKLIGKSMDINANKTYYPIMSTRYHDTEYHLVD